MYFLSYEIWFNIFIIRIMSLKETLTCQWSIEIPLFADVFIKHSSSSATFKKRLSSYVKVNLSIIFLLASDVVQERYIYVFKMALIDVTASIF